MESMEASIGMGGRWAASCWRWWPWYAAGGDARERCSYDYGARELDWGSTVCRFMLVPWWYQATCQHPLSPLHSSQAAGEAERLTSLGPLPPVALLKSWLPPPGSWGSGVARWRSPRKPPLRARRVSVCVCARTMRRQDQVQVWQLKGGGSCVHGRLLQLAH